ncbi:MAG: hypothetical protein R3F49_00815 [Planctomycetota bacterium]
MARLITLIALVVFAGVARAQATYVEFKDRFEKAQVIGAKDELKRLFQSHEPWAIQFVAETAEAIANSPNERIQTRFATIAETWAATKSGDFVKNMERYFSYLDPPSVRERFRIKSQYDKATNYFVEAEAAKERGKLNALAEQFKGYAEGLEALGDKYLAGNAWLFRALCLDEAHQGPSADLREVAAAYRKLVDLRIEIDLKDRFYRETEPALKRLEGLGFGGGSKGGGEEGGAGPVAATAGKSISAVPAFEVVSTLDTFSRPNYFLDDHYPIWDSIRFGKVGSVASLPRVPDSPKFIRTGSTKVEIDTDGDGVGDLEVPARGKLEPFEFEIGKGSSKRKWALLFQAGNQSDQYQGIELSNAASDENWSLFLSPGASVVADIEGVRLQVFDDNMDGAFGSAPTGYGHLGITPGLFQPEFDTMLIGEAKRAMPWSQFAKFPSGWMKLESQDGGARFLATPTEMRTGKLKLESKGVAPEYLIMQGANDFEQLYIDIAGAKEVEVPVGRYRVYWGLVAKGSKKQLVKALVLPGDNAPTYEVMEGQTVSVKFGAPYDFVFQSDVADETITISGKSIALVGAGGERYERIYGAVLRPEASYRKAGTKRGSKPASFDIIQDRDGFDRKGGYEAMWKPLDLVLPKKANEADVEVQLTEKKNKLFGKIDGTWQ